MFISNETVKGERNKKCSLHKNAVKIFDQEKLSIGAKDSTQIFFVI